jgi:poly(A) polymerase
VKPSYETAKSIIDRLRQGGHQALLAGGCVRDYLLGREPKDFDIATSARPEVVQALFPHSEAVGAQFGVILVIEDGAAYEVATFRTEGPYQDGRRPESVVFSTPQEDASRRDFTVNGLFDDTDNGEILDFVKGQADLDARLIRCIGDPDRRFEEDKLRLLRAARFAAELGFEVEPATLRALQTHASQASSVAWERTAVEFTKLLACPGRRRGLELMDRTGLLKALIPELEAGKGCSQPPQFHPEGDVWVHTLLLMEKLEDPGPALAWAGLLHDIGKPATRSQEPGDRIRFNRHDSVGADLARGICQRFKLSAALTESVVTLVADHLRLDQVYEMRLSTLKRLLRRDDIEDLLALHKADCLASHGGMEIYDFCRHRLEEFRRLGDEQALRPRPLLTGDDLIRLGYQPGPSFKAMLEALETEQLEGRLSAASEAEAFLQSKFGPSTG